MFSSPSSPARASSLWPTCVFSLLLFGLIAVFSANFKWRDGPRPAPFAGDFVQEYVGGYVVVRGDHSRFYDVAYADELEHDADITGFQWEPGRWLPMIYPPFYYLLVAPLYLLPIRIAALVWLALMVVAFVGALVLLARRFPERTVLFWALPAGAAFLPLLESLTSGQKGSVVLLIFTAAYLLLDRGRPFAAGLIFGLVTFKPHLALLIGFAMVLKGQWRFVGGALLTTLLFIGLCFVVGADVCRQYFQVSQRMSDYIETSGYPLAQMHSWYGFWRLLLPGRPLGQVQIVTVAAGAVTVAVLIRLLWGPMPFGQPRFALQYSGMVLATLLLSPHLLTYDLTLLLLPIVLLVVVLTEKGSSLATRMRLSLWLLAVLYLGAGLSSGMAAYMHVQISVVLMFVVLVQLARLAMGDTPGDALSPPI